MECEILRSPMISYRSLLYSTTVLYDNVQCVHTYMNVKSALGQEFRKKCKPSIEIYTTIKIRILRDIYACALHMIITTVYHSKSGGMNYCKSCT